jgi:tyrosinase
MRAFMALTDDRGYRQQAAIHGLPLPISCEHGTLMFLPWHRAYLYLFERRLQDRGDANIGLPWWDWTSAASHASGIPAAYTERRVGNVANPLFDFNPRLPASDVALLRADPRTRGALTAANDPRTRREPDLPDELPRQATIRSILAAPTFADFSRRLENVHDGVHIWVGGTMSVVPTAAYDPIFWAHHAMIDRLWYLWQLGHPGSDPPASMMNRALAPFPLTVAQVLDISRLGYDYAVGGVT